MKIAFVFRIEKQQIYEDGLVDVFGCSVYANGKRFGYMQWNNLENLKEATNWIQKAAEYLHVKGFRDFLGVIEEPKTIVIEEEPEWLITHCDPEVRSIITGGCP